QGEGSTFTLYLARKGKGPLPAEREPDRAKPQEMEREPDRAKPEETPERGHREYVALEPSPAAAQRPLPEGEAKDDRDNIQSGDLVMMIVSSELESSGHILNLVRGEGFNGIIVTRAD